MTFMTAVFSYNRGQLLANCVRSIELFSPETKLVVFDDKSDDPLTLAALDDIAARGHEVVVNEEVSTARHGNLYPNLNRALHLAHSRQFRLLHLVEDDTQFVWRNADLEADVAALLAAFPKAAGVGAYFWKLATKARGDVLPGHPAYRMRYGPGSQNTFVDVPRLVNLGFRYQADEASTMQHGASLGLEALALAHPVVTRIPWPMYARHRGVTGDHVLTDKPLLIKPLSDDDIRRLATRNIEQFPYAEDYCLPWGWRCWKPYGWTSSYRSWARGLLSVARHRRSIRGLIPRRVGEKA
jgi:hypothetical protein